MNPPCTAFSDAPCHVTTEKQVHMNEPQPVKVRELNSADWLCCLLDVDPSHSCMPLALVSRVYRGYGLPVRVAGKGTIRVQVRVQALHTRTHSCTRASDTG